VAFLPSKDRHYLFERGLAFEEVVSGSINGVVFPQWALPAGYFDHAAASLLIVIPNGYPDLPPDMFYVNPWIKLAATGKYARCADQPYDFNTIRWQRWSRHNKEWRRGIDGIKTMLKRVEHALAEAK
jgi:Prokaryotic E2 family E